jgi:hypothetical protein
MRWFYLESIILSVTVSLVRASPTSLSNLTTKEDDFKAQYRLFGFHGCSSNDKNAIYSAFNEKDTITGVQSVFHVEWNSAAAIDYFGYVSTTKPSFSIREDEC